MTIGRDYHCANVVFPKEFEQISRAHCELKVKIDTVLNDGYDFIEKITGEELELWNH